jgi:hypothetical protein
MHMNRSVVALGCLWFACLANAANKMAAEPDYAYRPKPEQGTVMLRIITNRNIAPQISAWSSITLRRKGDPMEHSIALIRLFAGGDAYYIRSLPPGDYTATSVATTGMVNYMPTDLWATLDPKGAWTFRIEAGRMTNLGTLFYLIPQGAAQEERYRWVHFPDSYLPQRMAYLFHPDDYPQLLSTQLTWSAIPAEVSQSTLRPRERQLSLKLGGGLLASDGGRLFGEFMGQIAWRRADGSWVWEDTGTLETILMAADATDGVRYAFASSSHMLRRHAPNDWRRVTVPFDGAQPCHVQPEPQGRVLVVWDADEKIVVTRYQHGSDSPWETVHELATPVGFWQGEGGCQAVSNGEKLVLIQTFMTSKRRLQILDLGTRKFVESEFKNSESFDMLPEGMIYAMHRHEAKRELRVTKDFGRTWEQYDAKWFMKTLYRTPDEGLALRGFGMLGQDGKQITNRSLWGTSDGGRTWKPLLGLMNDTDNMLLLPGKALLFTTGNGVLYSWPGEGNTPRNERALAR